MPEPPNLQGDLSEPLLFYGNYCGSFGGVSLHDASDRTFGIDLVGTPLSAYFVWSGRASGWNTTGDGAIQAGVNGNTLQAVAAAEATQIRARSDAGFSWFTYAAPVPSELLGQLQDGSNSIRVTGLDLQENHGVGLLVLTEELERCPFQAIGMFFGNDVLYHGWTDTSGPNSDVTCFNFPPPPEPVEIDIQMFVGGVENPLRSNAIWAETGSGENPPDNLVGRPTAVELVQPLRGLNGDEFDNYDTIIQDPQPIIAQPGDTWACFQIESPSEPFPDLDQGISATWINLAVRVPLAEIAIDPDGVNPLGVQHTFTITVNSAFGYPESLVITPTVEPAPDSMVDDCDTPTIDGKLATCTVTINSNVPGTFTASAEASIPLNEIVAFVSTNGLRENSGPAVKIYVGEPAIDIEKATNGEDADEKPGPLIVIGEAVTWTYAVENTGNVSLSYVVVNDDQGVAVTCPQDELVPGEVMICYGNGTATLGEYANNSDVRGIDPEGIVVTDEDPSHYTGVEGTTDVGGVDEPDNPLLDRFLFVPISVGN